MNDEIRLENAEPRFYARIPNMIIDDLPYDQLALYVHYKRIASDNGGCWQSVATTAQALSMSTKRVRRLRDKLADRGLIAITQRTKGTDTECQSKIITD